MELHGVLCRDQGYLSPPKWCLCCLRYIHLVLSWGCKFCTKSICWKYRPLAEVWSHWSRRGRSHLLCEHHPPTWTVLLTLWDIFSKLWIKIWTLWRLLWAAVCDFISLWTFPNESSVPNISCFSIFPFCCFASMMVSSNQAKNDIWIF